MKVERWRCWICGHESKDQTESCEKQGLCVPYFSIGTIIKFQRDQGQGYWVDENCEILDILFPYPPRDNPFEKKEKPRFLFSHNYQVYYLVRLLQERRDAKHFFDQENNHLLREVQTLDIVNEDWVYDIPKNRPAASSWQQFCDMTLRKNPQLQDRLRDFTVELTNLDCLGHS